MDRRSALKGIGLIIASATAPAIIPIKNIMPVRLIVEPMTRVPMFSGDAVWCGESLPTLNANGRFSFIEIPTRLFNKGISTRWTDKHIEVFDMDWNLITKKEYA